MIWQRAMTSPDTIERAHAGELTRNFKPCYVIIRIGTYANVSEPVNTYAQVECLPVLK